MPHPQSRHRGGTRTKALFWGVVGALAVHAGLAAYLWSHGLLPRLQQPPQEEKSQSAGGGASGTGDETDRADGGAPSGESADAASLLRKEMQFTQRLTHQQQEAELHRQADKIGKSVRAEEIPAMKRFIESAAGVGGRAYEPRPDAQGPFDPNTATLYDIARRVDESGAVDYQITLLDDAGRTLKHAIPESQMPSDMLRAYRVFEMARQKPALRPLVDLSLMLGNEWFAKKQKADGSKDGTEKETTDAHR